MIDADALHEAEQQACGQLAQMDLALAAREAATRVVAEASPDRLRPEREDRLDRTDAWIDREVEEHEDFGLQDLDEHVLELCRAAGLPEALARRYRDLPRAPRGEDPATGGYNFEGKPEPGRRETG